ANRTSEILIWFNSGFIWLLRFAGRRLAGAMPLRAIGTSFAWGSFDENHERHSYMNAPLDSRQLRAFCVLARTGSFTQTARELHLTQSAVSHSMKALENEIGCRL